MPHDEQTWPRYLAELGYPGAQQLASGMEGTVYRLRDELVAKVWKRKPRAELLPLKAFYDELANADLPFATPRFVDLRETQDGLAVTIEPQLAGTPLDERCPPAEGATPAVADCLLGVLAALGEVAPAPSLRALPVVEEPEAAWHDGVTTWSRALLDLMDRRVALFGDQLLRAVPALDTGLPRLRELIAELSVPDLGVIHGDLIPANVLVDEQLRPTAVLDFGFFSTVGDPLFDVAVTASIFEMYGPEARAIEAGLDAVAARRFPAYTPARAALYRAAYAVITSNVYDQAGEDGHFAWCAAMLRRGDVAELLATGSIEGSAT